MHNNLCMHLEQAPTELSLSEVGGGWIVVNSGACNVDPCIYCLIETSVAFWAPLNAKLDSRSALESKSVFSFKGKVTAYEKKIAIDSHNIIRQPVILL